MSHEMSPLSSFLPIDKLSAIIDKWSEGMPPIDHTRELVARLAALESDFPDSFNPKKLLQKLGTLYPGLSLIEQFSALKSMSSEAHLVTPEQDPELYRIFEEAFAAHQSHSGGTSAIPRLIVMKSDFPRLATTNSCSNQQTIFVSSKSQEILTPDELKSCILHEFGHLNRDLHVPMYRTAPWQTTANMLTRNSTRRAMEYAADSYAIQCGSSPEDLISSLRKQQDYMQLFSRAISDQMEAEIREIEAMGGRTARIIAWVMKKKAADMHLPNDEHKTTWMERLCKAPPYPTQRERVDNIYKTAAQERHI